MQPGPDANLLEISYKLPDPKGFWDSKATLCMRQRCPPNYVGPKFSGNFGARFPDNDLRGETRKKNQKNKY
jgi:hypothetical protein